MPSGKVHTGINLSVLSGFCLLYFSVPVLTDLFSQVVFWNIVAGALVGTFLLTPDLDMRSRNLARSNWGCFGFLWTPYAAVFRHRGMSHSYVLGPLLRAGYAAVLLLPLYLACAAWWPSAAEQLHGAALYLGYLVMQWSHSLADGIPLSHDLTCLKRRAA